MLGDLILHHSYSVFLETGNQREFLIEGDSPIQEEAEPILMMEPWVPLAAKQHVIVRAEGHMR